MATKECYICLKEVRPRATRYQCGCTTERHAKCEDKWQRHTQRPGFCSVCGAAFGAPEPEPEPEPERDVAEPRPNDLNLKHLMFALLALLMSMGIALVRVLSLTP